MTINVKFGLALGGGGVKGLAHIALLKKLDELSIKPSYIAGTSIGALIGALYATGLSGKQIEERIKDHVIHKHDSTQSIYKKSKNLTKWFRVFSFDKNQRGIFSARGLFEHLFTELIDHDFEDLSIPFAAVATNFYTGKELVITDGDLLTGIQASIAVPGVFSAIERDGILLVDGGLVNNLPCSVVAAKTPMWIASDVMSLPKGSHPKTPQLLSGAVSIVLHNQTAQTLERFPPRILFQPSLQSIDAFDFHKINIALDAGNQAIEHVSSQLEALKKI